MTACKVLADEYEKKGSADIASKLRADAASMRKFVMAPRKRVGMDEVGGLNNEVIDGGILYANRRFFIPWGWYANAVSSLCSTSWSIMEGLVRHPTPQRLVSAETSLLEATPPLHSAAAVARPVLCHCHQGREQERPPCEPSPRAVHAPEHHRPLALDA